MKVLFVTFECVPFVKVGGLADVAGTLPGFINKEKKYDIKVILPLHKKIDREKFSLRKINKKLSIPIGDKSIEAELWTTNIDGLDFYFIEAENYYGREDIYCTPEGEGYPDNSQRYIFFPKSVLAAAKAINFQPDIIHCNDMHTGFIPAYLKTIYKTDTFFQQTKTVFTIHNINFQGIFPAEVYREAGFSQSDSMPAEFEYRGNVNLLKTGISFSDIITTVSPTYSKEIQSSHEYGCGLESILSARTDDIYGIVNGIDYTEWNPEKDSYIAAKYGLKNINGKAVCKHDLIKQTGMKENLPLIGMVTRLDAFKGFDILIESMDKIMSLPVQLFILGTGNKVYHDKLSECAEKYPAKLNVNLRFDNSFAHRIYAGSDFFLMPSKTEPCGLGQMIAMHYGTVPIVHSTGGLADTVHEFNPTTKKGTGFKLMQYSAEQLVDTIKKAISVYNRNTLFKKLMNNCLKEDFSWNKSVEDYIKVYEHASKKTPPAT